MPLNQKAHASEPDSFSFEDATLVHPGSRTYSSSVYSSVPAQQTRYYRMDLEYFDAGTTLGTLKTVGMVSGNLSIKLYDNEQNLLDNSTGLISFSNAKSYFPAGCYDCVATFYMAVENVAATEADYGFSFTWNDR